MDQYTLEAYEALGHWQINLVHRHYGKPEDWWDELIYRGQHVPIDEEDPLVRAVLLLHQVYQDLNGALMGEVDILADRPPHH